MKSFSEVPQHKDSQVGIRQWQYVGFVGCRDKSSIVQMMSDSIE